MQLVYTRAIFKAYPIRNTSANGRCSCISRCHLKQRLKPLLQVDLYFWRHKQIMA